MPNGFNGSKEDWERMEAPLLLLDEELERFAEAQGGEVVKNYHDWPGRWVQWGEEVRRRVFVTQTDAEPPLFSIGVTAAEDRDRARYLKEEVVVEASPLETIQAGLSETLERARQRVEAWQSDDLEFATELKATTPATRVATQLASWTVALLTWVVGPLLLGYLVFRLVSCGGS